MINFIDDLLNRITMYRLVLYYLIFLLVVGFVLCFFGFLAYDPFALLLSVGFLLAVCAITNWAFARVFGVPANVESFYISALILALIISPIHSLNDLWFLAWAGVLAMASKFIVALNRKHIFNPIAFAVALTYFTINQSASWWVGNGPMLPFVILGGVLVVRKIGRWDLVLSFLLAALATIPVVSLIGGKDMFATTQQAILSSPLLFFAFVILTEPLTAPPTRRLRVMYGVLVGLLFAPQLNIAGLYVTPELAILAGNIFSYIVSPKVNLILRLKEKVRIAPDTYEFVFAPTRRFSFAPGQYMEWTLGHDDPDSRGNRRYFTLASSPTENNLRLGVKFYKNSSSYKTAMLSMERGYEIAASQLAGDFVLPQSKRQKIVLIAGGIGITPFRSMLKYLLDTRQRRPIVVFYANKTVDDIVYKDVLDRAEHELAIKTVYTITDTNNIPPAWSGKIRRISPELIKNTVPDFARCLFYISGPRTLVDSFKTLLAQMKVDGSQIKTDYFAGLA